MRLEVNKYILNKKCPASIEIGFFKSIPQIKHVAVITPNIPTYFENSDEKYSY